MMTKMHEYQLLTRNVCESQHPNPMIVSKKVQKS